MGSCKAYIQLFNNLMLFITLLSIQLLSSQVEAFDKCSIAAIHSNKKIGTHDFYQQGVGWVYGRKENAATVKIVTPAHVIIDNTKIFAECQGRSYELKILGVSPTLDLAVLDFKNPNEALKTFKPLFQVAANLTLSALDLSLFKMNTTSFPGVAYFSNSKIVFTNIGAVSSTNQPQEKFNYEFPQYTKSLLLTYGGIRPGMSGSPVFAQNNSLPLGMSLKTKINDHVTLIFPITELVLQLADLEVGQDPWLKKHPFYQIQYYHKYDAEKVTLKRFRKLLLNNPEGKPLASFKEKCEFGKMTEVSNWSPSGGSWADSGGSWSYSGGSWADSTGGTKQQTKTLYTGDLNKTTPASDETMLLYSGATQYFLSKETCDQEGLFVEQSNDTIYGLQFDEFKNEKLILKIDSIENILLTLLKLEQENKPLDTVLKSGLYKNSGGEDFGAFCKSYLLGVNLKAYGNIVDNSEQTTFLPIRPWTDLDLKNFLKNEIPDDKATNNSNHMLIMKEKKYLSTSAVNELVYLQCSEDKKTIEIVSANADIAYHFIIEKNKFSGTFSFDPEDVTSASNKYQFAIATEHFWNYVVENKEQGYKIQVQLDPLNDPLVSIRFLEIPKEKKTKHNFGYQNALPPLEFIESLWFINN